MSYQIISTLNILPFPFYIDLNMIYILCLKFYYVIFSIIKVHSLCIVNMYFYDIFFLIFWLEKCGILCITLCLKICR